MSSDHIKPDAGLVTFLEGIGLTHGAFMSLSVIERSQIFSMYLQTIRPSTSSQSSSLHGVSSSSAIPPAHQMSSSIMPPPIPNAISSSSSLTDEEIYEILENSSEYKEISLNGYHFKRNKAIYPIREVNLPSSDIKQLTPTQVTWLSRVYAHVPVESIWNSAGNNMSRHYLMKTVFSLENLQRFDTLLHRLDSENSGLAPQTIYRAYTALISCIQTLTGKQGSLVDAKISNLSFKAIDRLTDFRNKWKRANTISINQSESKRINRVSEETITREFLMKQMYFLLCCERFWFIS